MSSAFVGECCSSCKSTWFPRIFVNAIVRLHYSLALTREMFDNRKWVLTYAAYSGVLFDFSGDDFFHGPYFMVPGDIEHSPTRLFYCKEVFLSSQEQTNPVLSITGRCSVLSYKEFTACRITEIAEEHVYICESKYIEPEKIIKKCSKPLRVSFSVQIQSKWLFILHLWK